MLKSTLNNYLVLLILVSITTKCFGQWGSPSEQAADIAAGARIQVQDNENHETEGNNHNNSARPHKRVPDGPLQPLPYALSSTYLTYLARTEMELYKDIKHYTKSLRERLALAEAYLADYEDSSVKGTEAFGPGTDEWQKASEVSSNPLLSYRMVRRFANEFDVFGAHVNQYLEGSKDFIANFANILQIMSDCPA